MWEKTPKDYVSTAVLKVDISPPYVDPQVRSQMVDVGLLNDEELEVLRNLKSIPSLSLIGENFNAWQRWGVDQADGIDRLRRSISFELGKDKNLVIRATQHDPMEAQEFAQIVVERTTAGLSEIAEIRSQEGLKSVDQELSATEQLADDAKAEFVGALKVLGVTVDPKLGMDLEIYAESDQNVLTTKIAWERATRNFLDRQAELRPMTRHWERKVTPAIVIQAADMPTGISGPLKEPFQTQGAVVGVTLGLFLGLLAMLMCWKLFS